MRYCVFRYNLSSLTHRLVSEEWIFKKPRQHLRRKVAALHCEAAPTPSKYRFAFVLDNGKGPQTEWPSAALAGGRPDGLMLARP